MWPNKIYDVEYWYTLGEVFAPCLSSSHAYDGTVYMPYGTTVNALNTPFFKALVGDETQGLALGKAYKLVGTPNTALNKYLEQLLCVVYSRYYDHYCLNLDHELSPDNFVNTNDLLSFWLKVINIIGNTYDKYATLLDLYESKKSNLLAKIETSHESLVGFNDTPQELDIFNDDVHTTNVTQSTGSTSTDGSSIMSRIKEIENSFGQTMRDWSDEFAPLFIEEVNLQ